ncbi:MAG: ORF6N domain-containing protein [bacterium]
MRNSSAGVLATDIPRAIIVIRGKRVMLDASLASLYGVPTRALVQAVRRNIARFPDDFVSRLIRPEVEDLRSQIVISSSARGWGGRRHAPYVFTEQGVAMLSSVLHSRRAIETNIAIMRAFVRLRQMVISNETLAHKLEALEKKYDANFKVVFDAIRNLMLPPEARRMTIGFRPPSGMAEGKRGTDGSVTRGAPWPRTSPASASKGSRRSPA